MFIKTFFFTAFLLVMFCASFIFFMDPNWTFSHSHRFNNMQAGYNERMQKSNLLVFRKNDYDALLFGSSRVTFFNQYDFKKSHLFNYAFSLAMPQEYAPYIHFAKMHNTKSIKKIYIGVDFFGSNKNFHNDVKPSEVFDSIQSCCYRYKMLFSIDSLKTAVFNLKASLANNPGYRSYKRNNVTMSKKRSKASIMKDVRSKKVSQYMGDIAHYQFNPHYVDILENLKKENPHTTFIIFTTPTSAVYLQKLFDLGYKDAYKKWLKTLVDTFGEVYHFMYFNDVSKHYENYFLDYHHLYPKFTRWIVEKLEQRDSKDTPKDFGILLNKHNIQNYLDKI